MAMMKPKKQRTDRIESTGGGARGSGGNSGIRWIDSGPGASKGVKVSPNVTVVRGTVAGGGKGSSARAVRGTEPTGGKMMSGAEQARAQNARMTASKQTPKGAKALKSIQKTTKKPSKLTQSVQKELGKKKK